MVFDGRLVIDANFYTNDPHVRAAGTLTKYSRKYHADGANFRHENQRCFIVSNLDKKVEILCDKYEQLTIHINHSLFLIIEF